MNRLLVELQQAGELEVEPIAGPNYTNIYHVRVSCPPECDRSFNHRGGEPQFRGGLNHSSGEGVNHSSDKPSLEPSLNQDRGPTRLPKDWKPSEKLLNWAAKEFPDLDVQMHSEAFVDYWTSKASMATKRDWDATWRNWIRNSHLRFGRRKQSAAEMNMNIVRKYQKGQLSG